MHWTAPAPRAALTAALLACASASAALAQSSLGAEAFDQFTQGKTLYYFSNGQPYGVEQYLPNRRVIWSFLDGQCQYGSWYENGPQICFEYEESPGPQCWQFFLEGGQLRAVFEDGTEGDTPYVADEAPEDMLCLGPEVGV